MQLLPVPPQPVLLPRLLCVDLGLDRRCARLLVLHLLLQRRLLNVPLLLLELRLGLGHRVHICGVEPEASEASRW
jgi:hypothetical protein